MHDSQGFWPGDNPLRLQNGQTFGSTSGSASSSSLRNPMVSRQPQSRHLSSQASMVNSADSKKLYLQFSGQLSRSSPCGHFPPGGLLGLNGGPFNRVNLFTPSYQIRNAACGYWGSEKQSPRWISFQPSNELAVGRKPAGDHANVLGLKKRQTTGPDGLRRFATRSGVYKGKTPLPRSSYGIEKVPAASNKCRPKAPASHRVVNNSQFTIDYFVACH